MGFYEFAERFQEKFPRLREGITLGCILEEIPMQIESVKEKITMVFGI